MVATTAAIQFLRTRAAELEDERRMLADKAEQCVTRVLIGRPHSAP